MCGPDCRDRARAGRDADRRQRARTAASAAVCGRPPVEQAAAEEVDDGTGVGGGRRFARPCLGRPSAGVDCGRREGRLSKPAAGGVLHSGAPPILEFDPAGNMVNAFGGPGAEYEWPATEHGIFVDHKDNVWTAGSGSGDAQILKFTNKGKFLLQIGRRGQSKDSNDIREHGAAGRHLRAREDQRAVCRRRLRQPPRHRLRRRHRRLQAPLGRVRKEAGGHAAAAARADIRDRRRRCSTTPCTRCMVSNDDIVYVADRGNNRLQVFALDGTFVREAFVKRDTLQSEGTVHDFGFSPDKEQRFLYVVDGSNKCGADSESEDARDRRFSRRARRTRRAGILPHPQHGGRFEGQHLPRRGEPGTAVHEVRVQGDGSARHT